jgi:hypothetical protein
MRIACSPCEQHRLSLSRQFGSLGGADLDAPAAIG